MSFVSGSEIGPARLCVCAVGVTQVVFDPSWNPAHDLQAQDRAYRLGQTRDVAVYRLVGTGGRHTTYHVFLDNRHEPKASAAPVPGGAPVCLRQHYSVLLFLFISTTGPHHVTNIGNILLSCHHHSLYRSCHMPPALFWLAGPIGLCLPLPNTHAEYLASPPRENLSCCAPRLFFSACLHVLNVNLPTHIYNACVWWSGTLEEAVYKRQIYKQQQSNMVIDGAQEPRYWEGVQVGCVDRSSSAAAHRQVDC